MLEDRNYSLTFFNYLSAVFDSAKMLMTVYDDKPDVCQGHDFEVPHCHGSEKYRVPKE